MSHHQPDPPHSEDSIEAAIAHLGYRERRVVALRMDGLTLAEIASIFKVTRERVRQIQVQSVKKISAKTGLDRETCLDLLGLHSHGNAAIADSKRVFPGSIRAGAPLTDAEVDLFDTTIRDALREGLIAGRYLAASVLGGSASARVRDYGFDKLRAYGAYPRCLGWKWSIASTG